jgi:hypothetical protein
VAIVRYAALGLSGGALIFAMVSTISPGTAEATPYGCVVRNSDHSHAHSVCLAGSGSQRYVGRCSHGNGKPSTFTAGPWEPANQLSRDSCPAGEDIFDGSTETRG